MKPDTPEILDSILWSLETYVEPEVQSPFGRSVMVTVGNLLRHVKLRAETEAEILFEDNDDLERLLTRLVARFEAHPELSKVLESTLAGVRAVLAAGDEEKKHFPTVARLSARAEALRQSLDDLLKALGSVRFDFPSDETYIGSREEIRAYLARQLQRADQLISPAFVGGRR